MDAHAIESPTIASPTVKVGLQIIASCGLRLSLLDIANAFCQGGTLKRERSKIFVEMPKEETLPGVPPGSIIELIVPAYGLNDAPALWHRKLRSFLLSEGWKPLSTDSCCFVVRKRDDTTPLTTTSYKYINILVTEDIEGLIMLHVDDMVIAGKGLRYSQKVKNLQFNFQMGAWKDEKGEYFGCFLEQMPDCSVRVSQYDYAMKIGSIKVSKTAHEDVMATVQQIRSAREVLEQLSWLCKQTRGDIAVQRSFGQQAMPDLQVKHLRQINQAVRRARQHAKLCITYENIPMSQLALIMHSGSSLANVKRIATQGGYVVAATERKILENKTAKWSPLNWRSGRLQRVVNSTLAGEAQSQLQGARELEWIQVAIIEAVYNICDHENRHKFLRMIPSTCVTDAKSLYDAQRAKTGANVADREAALDVICLKQIATRTGHIPRWMPGPMNPSDIFTKDSGSAAELFRSIVRTGKYTLASVDGLMMQKAEERELRQREATLKAFQAKNQKRKFPVDVTAEQQYLTEVQLAMEVEEDLVFNYAI